MGKANASGHSLTNKDASIILGMVARGDREHDIAAWFGVNHGLPRSNPVRTAAACQLHRQRNFRQKVRPASRVGGCAPLCARLSMS
jgi:hypothetical protein